MKKKQAKLRAAIKKKDGWWASLFSGPLANRLLEPICDIEWISPNLITIFSFFIGILAALCFANGSHRFLILGAILVQLSFTVDCMDGQLARYRQQFSNLGAWLDRVSDRVKDFLYFFSLAWGFFFSHPENFHLGLSGLNNLIANIMGDKIFSLNSKLQTISLQHWELPTWIIWPLAMIAMFTVFLIDYYVNQDMKLESPTTKSSKKAKDSLAKTLLKPILELGLASYKNIPILRFNIGEQALLISLFAIFDASFLLILCFALLGSFYSVFWPVMKYLGYSPNKD